MFTNKFMKSLFSAQSVTSKLMAVLAIFSLLTPSVLLAQEVIDETVEETPAEEVAVEEETPAEEEEVAPVVEEDEEEVVVTAAVALKSNVRVCSISVTNVATSTITNVVDLSGTAECENALGAGGKQYQVSVDWGDGTIDEESTVDFTDGKDFSGSWSNSHEYSSFDNYDVVISLYHVNTSGNDDPDDTASEEDILGFGEGSTDPVPTDTDEDTIPDDEDNCPLDANTDQADADGDDIGDVCDSTPNGENNAPYCGDDIVNQDWEQCDGGAFCTEQCLFPVQTQCLDIALARVNVTEFENQGDGDVSDNLFLGSIANALPNNTWFPIYLDGAITDPDVDGYEDVPGLAMERQDGALRLRMHTSVPAAHETIIEYVEGAIEFFNADVVSQVTDNNSNKLETPAQSSNPDVVSIEDNKSHFTFYANSGDDGFFTNYEVTENTCVIDPIGEAFIQGRKYRDVNENNNFDAEEKNDVNRLDDWMITLYNTDWVMIDQMLTSEDDSNVNVNHTSGKIGKGQYRFTNLAAGTYNVCEEVKADWTQLTPADGIKEAQISGAANITTIEDPENEGTYCYQVTLTDGQEQKNVRFGNLETEDVTVPEDSFEVMGYKFEDENQNGEWDEGENGLAGWEITIAQLVEDDLEIPAINAPIDSVVLEDGMSYLFNAQGTYYAADLIYADAMYSERNASGSWTDTVQNYEGWGPTLLDLQIDGVSPYWGEYTESHSYWTTVAGTGAPVILSTYDIAGGVNNSGNLVVDTYKVVATTTTASDGSYSFDDLEPGTYVIRETNQDGWTQIFPTADGSHIVEINEETDNGDLNFGNYNENPNQEPEYLKVRLVKYLDGELATTGPIGGYPMVSTWKTANLNGGATSSGSYIFGNYQGGSAYQYGADTSAMEAPAYYTSHEVTTDESEGSSVLSSETQCVEGKYRLVGYSFGDSLDEAESATKSTSTPEFYGLTADKYVIVWNELCGGSENTPPVIEVLGDNPFELTIGNTFVDPFASSTDAEDGDITSNIATSTDLDINTVGSYNFVYSVSDTDGAMAYATRTVNVVAVEEESNTGGGSNSGSGGSGGSGGGGGGCIPCFPCDLNQIGCENEEENDPETPTFSNTENTGGNNNGNNNNNFFGQGGAGGALALADTDGGVAGGDDVDANGTTTASTTDELATTTEDDTNNQLAAVGAAGTLFGLKWWWWILILILLGTIGYYTFRDKENY